METFRALSGLYLGSDQFIGAFRCSLLYLANGDTGFALVDEVSHSARFCPSPDTSSRRRNAGGVPSPWVLSGLCPSTGSLPTELLEKPLHWRFNQFHTALSVLQSKPRFMDWHRLGYFRTDTHPHITSLAGPSGMVTAAFYFYGSDL